MHALPGFRGGQPFQDYVQMHGKQVSLLKFDQICTGVFDHDQQLREFDVIVMKEKHTFLGFMLGSLAKISNHSKARQYHCTLLHCTTDCPDTGTTSKLTWET